MPGYKKPKMTGETREQIKKREERLQKESRERARKKREDFMSGKKPQLNKGTYKMKLGGKSAVRNTPGPFRAEVPYMYETKKPLMFRGQIRKASDTAKKADKAYRSEGNKNDPDYMKMMNKRK
tara:strand:- start:81 stop:449 length:369 start_codon:yes stop_codon:yes gene_type:complete